MTSYQKLKQEIERLNKIIDTKNKDIRELVFNPNSIDSSLIRTYTKFSRDLDNVLWDGDLKPKPNNYFDGILSIIKDDK